jgi:hypothetical protein
MTLELCIVMNWVSCVLTVLFGCSDLLLPPPSQVAGYGKLSGQGSGTSTRSVETETGSRGSVTEC